MATIVDSDPLETQEWREALDGVVEFEGPERAEFLLEQVLAEARRKGAPVPYSANTPYLNTIPPDQQARHPGDRAIEHRIRSLIRWNAAAMVLRANKESSELGGHIASFQSAATLYDAGFMWFWHAPSERHGGDLIYIQGHSSPGIYARAFLEGRLSEDQLKHFRQEVDGRGLSSYPHPWLMPEFWQFPTVSMGLGPIMAIYQARFMKYLQGRGLAETAGRKVWAFRGAGWNVIKVIWGSRWDPLLAADHEGHLLARMNEALDGDYQTYKSRNGAYVREHFFGTKPELRAMVADMTDEQIWALNRGGLDQRKVYAAYNAAVQHHGQPTVILAKTIKGYGMGVAGEGQNITHQQKKMNEEALLAFRDRFELPLTDQQVRDISFYKPPEHSPEMEFVRERRAALGGSLPARRA